MLSKARARALDNMIYASISCLSRFYLDTNLDKNGIGPPWLSSLVGRGIPHRRCCPRLFFWGFLALAPVAQA